MVLGAAIREEWGERMEGSSWRGSIDQQHLIEEHHVSVEETHFAYQVFSRPRGHGETICVRREGV